MDEGEFDNLAGKGKPLQRGGRGRGHGDEHVEHEGAGAATDLAAKIMKNANILPGWIQRGKTIRADRVKLRTELKLLTASGEWAPQASAVAAATDALNAQIRLHNAEAPSAVVQIAAFDLDKEIERATAQE